MGIYLILKRARLGEAQQLGEAAREERGCDCRCALSFFAQEPVQLPDGRLAHLHTLFAFFNFFERGAARN